MFTGQHKCLEGLTSLTNTGTCVALWTESLGVVIPENFSRSTHNVMRSSTVLCDGQEATSLIVEIVPLPPHPNLWVTQETPRTKIHKRESGCLFGVYLHPAPRSQGDASNPCYRRFKIEIRISSETHLWQGYYMKSCARTSPLQGDEEWLKEMYLRRERDPARMVLLTLSSLPCVTLAFCHWTRGRLLILSWSWDKVWNPDVLWCWCFWKKLRVWRQLIRDLFMLTSAARSLDHQLFRSEQVYRKAKIYRTFTSSAFEHLSSGVKVQERWEVRTLKESLIWLYSSIPIHWLSGQA